MMPCGEKDKKSLSLKKGSAKDKRRDKCFKSVRQRDDVASLHIQIHRIGTQVRSR